MYYLKIIYIETSLTFMQGAKYAKILEIVYSHFISIQIQTSQKR